MTEHLFSYGSLQSPLVQKKTFGREVESSADLLPGYRLGLVRIEDEAIVAASGMTHYNNIIYTGDPADEISGIVLSVTTEELQQADKYEEEADYTRIRVQLKSGNEAWVYASAKSIKKPSAN